MPDMRQEAVAVVSVHASPLSELGRGENGGMNLAIRRLCEGLSEHGVPSDVFVRRDSASAPDEELIAPRSRLVRLPVGPARELPKEEVGRLSGAFAEAVVAHAASERRQYRLVHAHYWHAGLVAQTLRRRWAVPWVQSFHTLALTKARAGLPLDPERAAAESALVAGADRLVAASVSEARDLIRLYHADRDRICVAQPGVDRRVVSPQDVSRLRAELGLGSRRVVLFAGRLEPLKGADTLLDAIEELRRDREFEDVVTLVAGDDSGDGVRSGGERERLQRRARALHMGDAVRFLGAVPHEQLAGYYALADVCVVPSRTESFGLVALEAQALGTPVVAAAVGGLTEIVEDGVTGHLVRSREPGDFASAIAGVLGDPEARTQMREEARARASRFTWTRAVDRLAAIYDRVTQRPVAAATPCGYADDEVAALAS